jgi:hypothetical protein
MKPVILWKEYKVFEAQPAWNATVIIFFGVVLNP